VGAGERWGCLSVDRASRFVVAWAFGPRTAALAEAVVQTTRKRTADRAGVAWISDGWEPYAEVVADTYCDPVAVAVGGRPWAVLHRTPGVCLTQMVKHRRGRRLVGVEVRPTIGPAVAHPHTVHVERFNGVLRDRLACLTRKTHAFAKDASTWDAAVSLALFDHNWLRPHPALRQPLTVPVAVRRYQRRTPAMALSLTDHPWSVIEFLTSPAYHHMRE
jgi:IS1 family transposase